MRSPLAGRGRRVGGPGAPSRGIRGRRRRTDENSSSTPARDSRPARAAPPDATLPGRLGDRGIEHPIAQRRAGRGGRPARRRQACAIRGFRRRSVDGVAVERAGEVHAASAARGQRVAALLDDLAVHDLLVVLAGRPAPRPRGAPSSGRRRARCGRRRGARARARTSRPAARRARSMPSTRNCRCVMSGMRGRDITPRYLSGAPAATAPSLLVPRCADVRQL